MPPVNRPNLFRPADYKPGAPIQRSLMGKNPLWPPVYRPGAAVVPAPLSAVPAAPIQPRVGGAPFHRSPPWKKPGWGPGYRPGGEEGKDARCAAAEAADRAALARAAKQAKA